VSLAFIVIGIVGGGGLWFLVGLGIGALIVSIWLIIRRESVAVALDDGIFALFYNLDEKVTLPAIGILIAALVVTWLVYHFVLNLV
jgi:hypothetical protein